MKKLTSPAVLRELLREYEFKFSKSLGQNFLIDETVPKKIIGAAMLGGGDEVLEIGPGFGTLTQVLCESAKKVISVEIDRDVIPILTENMREFDNFKVINEDILKVDLHELVRNEFDDKPFKIIANLPYYITTPIIMALIESRLNAEVMVFMVQKEVAERFAATAGGKEYGAITLTVDYFCDAEIIATVPPGSFMPQPKVTSAILKLTPRKSPKVAVKDEKMFFRTIKSAFAQRRKTLLNSLANSGGFGMAKAELESVLLGLEILPSRRGETLTIDEFAKLADALTK